MDDKSSDNQFKAACAAAGIEDFRIHDLRHTFGSLHAIGGTPQAVIQKMLGHQSAKSTEIYMNVARPAREGGG